MECRQCLLFIKFVGPSPSSPHRRAKARKCSNLMCTREENEIRRAKSYSLAKATRDVHITIRREQLLRARRASVAGSSARSRSPKPSAKLGTNLKGGTRSGPTSRPTSWQQLLAQTYTRPERGTKVRTTQMRKTMIPTRSILFPLVVSILLLMGFVLRVERWLDAGGLELGHVVSSDTSSGLRRAKVALKDRDLVICSLVRDSAGNILQNLNVMEEIAKHFKSVKYIIVENDSTDGTDHLLQEWAATRGDYVELVSMKIDNSLDIFLPGMPRHEKNYDLSTRRFAKMALLRNIYLEKLTMMPQTSDPNAIVMNVDLDLHRIPASETVESLRSIIAGERKMSAEWEAFCSNGITSKCIPRILGTEGCTFVRRDNGEFGRAYDSLAARFTDEEMKPSFVIQAGEVQPPSHVKKWFDHQIRGGLKLNDINADPVSVKSCFGGIAVYKATVLKGLRYEGGDCEHLSVHRKLKNNYIIPDFNVYYD